VGALDVSIGARGNRLRSPNRSRSWETSRRSPALSSTKT